MEAQPLKCHEDITCHLSVFLFVNTPEITEWVVIIVWWSNILLSLTNIEPGIFH